MEFVLLNKNDLPLVLDFLKKSAVWLNEKGIDYWQNWHEPTKLYTDWLLDGLIDEEFYLVRQNGIDMGIFRLCYEDDLFWGDRKERAGYIYSFTVDRDQRGQALGYQILSEIKNVIKANRCEYLRLSCASNVKGLIDYYKNYGFKEVGLTNISGEDLVLMEIKI